MTCQVSPADETADPSRPAGRRRWRSDVVSAGLSLPRLEPSCLFEGSNPPRHTQKRGKSPVLCVAEREGLLDATRLALRAVVAGAPTLSRQA